MNKMDRKIKVGVLVAGIVVITVLVVTMLSVLVSEEPLCCADDGNDGSDDDRTDYSNDQWYQQAQQKCAEDYGGVLLEKYDTGCDEFKRNYLEYDENGDIVRYLRCCIPANPGVGGQVNDIIYS